RSLLVALVLFAAPAHAFSRATSKTDSFGDTNWGAGYTVNGAVAYSASTFGGPLQLRTSGTLTGWARMMGVQKNLVQVEGIGLAGHYGVDVYVGGIQLFGQSYAGTVSAANTWSQTFFTASETVMIGPVPVT